MGGGGGRGGCGAFGGCGLHLSHTPPARKDSQRLVSQRFSSTEEPVDDVVGTPGKPGACRRRRHIALVLSGAY